MLHESIIESVEINAPQPEVFALITNRDRCVQLHPEWGTEGQEVSPDYPHAGSFFRSVPSEQPEAAYNTYVTDYMPNEKFSWQIEGTQPGTLSWSCQALPSGTKLVYEKTCPVSESDASDWAQREGSIAREWLAGLKNYAELRDGRLRLGMKWIMDRYLLKLRADQRRVILMLIVLQLVMFITFLAAAAGMGIVSLFL